MMPTGFESLDARARRHAEAGDWNAARAEWLAALAVNPDAVGVMLELSYVESLSDHYRAAREWVLRAVRKAPCCSRDETLTLLQRLRTFNEASILNGFAQALLADRHTPHNVLVECARQLSNINDFDLALRCAMRATDMLPGDPQARLLRGQLLANYGRVEEAAGDFNWVLARYPKIAIAWWKLARLRKQTPESNHIAQLQAMLATPGLHPDDVAALARALHKEFDDIGDHEDAWWALELLCKAARALQRHDPGETRALVDALIDWVPDVLEAGPPAADRTPVFIVGMHRSGTTLLEQMLDASPQVRGIGEIYDFTSEMRYATDHHCRIPIDLEIVKRARAVHFAEVGRRYLDGVAWRLGKESHFTDKQPVNFFNLGFICQALPHAKILHMVRDPVETCFSNLRELFSEVNPHSYDQQELAGYYLQYRRLMEHWKKRWPERILDVSYSALTESPESVMREVADFCGIAYVDAMRDPRNSTRAVATASALQVRDAVARLHAPKWMPYARHLQPLIRTLRAGGVEAAV